MADTLKFSTPAGEFAGTEDEVLKFVGTPAGITWQRRMGNSWAGKIVMFIPVDAEGNNVSGVYGHIAQDMG